MTAEPNLLRALDYPLLQQCMHCGMCLPSCPTYAATKLERHSPRGRIALMRAIADGELEPAKPFAEEMYYCLGCLACTSACPAGVRYAELFETARAEIERRRLLDSPKRNLIRWSVVRVLFTRPRLLRLAGRLLWLWQAGGGQRLFRKLRLNRLLPRNLRRLEPQAPRACAKFSHQLIAPVEHPRTGRARRRVALLTGCVQDLVFSDINRATADVLLANGCEVHTPPVQPCCGSLHAHNGDLRSARELARRQLDLIDPFAFDAIISNAGGCGSHLRAYGHLLHDDARYAARAAEWSRKLRDIHEFLVGINFRKPAAPGGAPAQSEIENPKSKIENPKSEITLTYHESCHLCHGQKISAAPREVLRALPGARLVECAESSWCCGSAGIYNITQPETSAWLLRRKLGHLRATHAAVVATANPGCHIQLENGLRESGAPGVAVAHPVALLAKAYREEGAI
ncbi:MAG: (Fe-S)-binding protein [Opitutaceae bacterium]|jgi:glycolate oxidase iron-sulfur subunit|nr:(Fe-S)-binding protein [Opitutaceae bacterium]